MEINKFQELPDYINALPEDYIKSMGGITHTVDNLYPTLYGGHNLYRYPKKKVLVVAEPTDALVLQYLLPNIVVVATGKDKETDAL